MSRQLAILNTVAADPVLDGIATGEGIKLDSVSFIQLTDIADRVEGKLLHYSEQTLTVVFTSVQAVRSVCSKEGFGAAGWRVFCLGGATVAVAKRYLPNQVVASDAKDAAGLADVIIKEGSTTKVVFFCGDKRMDTLPGKLKGAGIAVEELVVYETRETPVEMEAKYDGVLFFSPSAVSSYFSMNEPGEGVVMFAIGNTTAEALKQRAKNKVVVSDVPVKEQVLRLAIAYLKQQEKSLKKR